MSTPILAPSFREQRSLRDGCSNTVRLAVYSVRNFATERRPVRAVGALGAVLGFKSESVDFAEFRSALPSVSPCRKSAMGLNLRRVAPNN